MAENLLVQRVDAIRRLARRGHAAPLAKVIAKSRAEDLAAVLGHLTAPEQRLVFANVKDDGMAAAVLTSLQGDDLLHIAGDMPPERFVALFEHLAADDQTDLLGRLPEELRESILQRMQGEAREEVEELLGYASDTAGGIMSPLAFRLQDNLTCRDAIAAVQEAADHELIYYAYVENDDGQLVGVTSLRNLLTHPPSTKLADIMSTDVLSVRAETDQEEVARVAAKYDLLAVPVVDEARRLLGIVTVDDVIDVIKDEAAEDMLLMAGVRETEDEPGGRVRNALRRLPWLTITLLGGLLISELISAFDGMIKAEIVLAGFIPIVMGMEGNVGIQAATVTVRGIATGRIDTGVARAVGAEVFNGLFLGVVFAVAIGGYCLLRFGEADVAASVAVAVITGMTSASLVGTLVPLSLRRFGVDPAIATGPFVTTAMDGVGLTIYLSVAALLLS